MDLHDAALEAIDARTLYAILRLRVDVFVVEQACAYAELDGRDAEPHARQVWIDDGAGRVLATLRVLRDPDGATRIGRVATAVDARGRGLAAQLMRHVLEHADPRQDVVLDAQSYLYDWYARFGFVRDGADFLDDGIPHVPMRRSAEQR